MRSRSETFISGVFCWLKNFWGYRKIQHYPRGFWDFQKWFFCDYYRKTIFDTPWSSPPSQKTPEMNRSRWVDVAKYFYFFITPSSRGDIDIWKLSKSLSALVRPPSLKKGVSQVRKSRFFIFLTRFGRNALTFMFLNIFTQKFQCDQVCS